MISPRLMQQPCNKNTPKITITAKITKITNQGSNTGKYNKSLKDSRERNFTDVTKIPKITIIAKITKTTNQGSNTGKYNKSLKENRERRFTNVTKRPKTTAILDY